MRCGNCKESHETVDAVRACYTTRRTAEKEGPVRPPSDAQINYVLGLQEERNMPDGYLTRTKGQLANMDSADVSDIIQLLKECTRKEGTSGGEYSMPAGRYAVQDDDGVWRFYEVSKPTEGRWKGYTFIKMLVGSPGQYQKVQMAVPARKRVLTIIEANQKQAMLDYGMQSGVCGRCSSPLTDPQSLARGIGPKCATMSGWF